MTLMSRKERPRDSKLEETMIRVVCENCGAVYKVNRKEDKVFCTACGTKLDYEREERERREKEAAIDLAELFTHPSDKAALDALKAIPGFSALMKAFMSSWNEKQFRIMNMSSNLRLSEKQMPKYYQMLPPICEKLGIEVPELYLKLDVHPNAYTSGDTKPFIVLTSGLLETLPDELIPTVLAHECGHIACHHVLYSTMGKILLGGASSFLGGLVTLPVQMAFAYWMRCSEFSADRAAVICDGTHDKMIETCFRFAGYDKDILLEGNIDAFLEQAEEYNKLVGDSKWNKSLEFMMYSQIDHPLNAVRASECKSWCEGEQYGHILSYIHAKEQGIPGVTGSFSIPMPQPSKYYCGINKEEAVKLLSSLGFSDIDVQFIAEKKQEKTDDTVIRIEIDGQDKFSAGTWFSSDAKVSLFC